MPKVPKESWVLPHINQTQYHTVANLKITVIKQVKRQTDIYRKEREEYFVKKFNTYHAGMDRKQ